MLLHKNKEDDALK
ncbi:unnamed protein product, partial [Rotaria magnacalcarata]